MTGERGGGGRVASVSPSEIDTMSWKRASGTVGGFVSKKRGESLVTLS